MPLIVLHQDPNSHDQVSLFYNGDKIVTDSSIVISDIAEEAIHDANKASPKCSICLKSYNIVFTSPTIEQIERIEKNLFKEMDTLHQRIKAHKGSAKLLQEIKSRLQQVKQALEQVQEDRKTFQECMDTRLVLLPCPKKDAQAPTRWERFISFFYKRNVSAKTNGSAHHIFCSECIQTWIFNNPKNPTEFKNRSCPLCHRAVTAEDLLEKNEIPDDLKGTPTTFRAYMIRQIRLITRAVKPVFILITYFSITMLLLKMKISIALQGLQLFIIALHIRKFFF